MSETREQPTMTVEVTPTPHQTDTLPTNRTILDVKQTTCCIVGGGPAGAVLGLMLARQGVSVMLLESHKNFERDFRGDNVHAASMEIMEQLGLVDRLFQQIPHTKTGGYTFITPSETLTAFDFSSMKSRHPYITIISQAKFLEFITAEAKRYPNFQLLMGANVQELIEEDGIIRGVSYRGQGGLHEVRAQLTVGADGRFSRIRQLAGMEPIKLGAPMDIFWFRLPRYPDEPKGLFGRFGRRFFVLYSSFEYWQVAYIIPKGYYQQLQAAGLDALRQSIVEVIPEFADRVEYLKDWKQAALLSVEVSRLSRWYRPGLFLIGDAAHVMSPVGGVGINCAIQDAVVAANVLGGPLKAGKLHLRHLARVQRRRQLSIRIIQEFQSFFQKQVTAKALKQGKAFRLPRIMHLPLFRHIASRLLAYGVLPPRVNTKLFQDVGKADVVSSSDAAAPVR